jgi:small conductance mechanosensitive channel
MEHLEKYMETIVSLSVQYGSKLLLALFVLMFGWWLIARLISLIDVAMDKHAVEQTLQRFVISFINIALKAVLLVAFASMIGVETASLLALLGAAGLAVGLALQGSLANFAGGVIILFFRPFKAGDVIEAQGYIGVVHEIQMFNTVVTTLDNQRVYIPNGLLSNGCVKNIFVEPTRRVDMVFGISYEDDLLKAKSVIKTVLDSNELVLKDPQADVYVSAHADSSINFTVRPWCQSENYWAVYFSVHEKVKLAFDQNNITIPFPQRDVHLIPQTGE